MKEFRHSIEMCNRRYFMRVTGLAGMDLLMGTPVYRLYRNLLSILKGKKATTPEGERKEYLFPQGWETVSVETALNSRCNSDDDEDPYRFHWGMFDHARKLSQSQIQKILSMSNVPRFTQAKVKIRADGPLFTFLVIQEEGQGIADWAMVESGMQQQVVGLLCAAMGVATVFQGMGDNGTLLSPRELATVRMRLGGMKPSYKGSYWTASPPSGPKPWRKGTLPEPDRKGGMPILSAIPMVKTCSEIPSGRVGTQALSQILWASRGRTPHFYKGRPWGMTLPVSRGDQDITTLYLISKGSLYRYVNWTGGRPTHDLLRVRTLDTGAWDRFCSKFGFKSPVLVWSRNEDTGRALWEVGYQLMNVFLQAVSLGCGHSAVLVEDHERQKLEKEGVGCAVACVVLG